MSDTPDQDIEAAREFARRAVKGLPADRLYDGAQGAHRVAMGILKLGVIIADYEDIERQRGEDAMRLHSGDTKQARKEAGQ
jgi:hypothetical protein